MFKNPYDALKALLPFVVDTSNSLWDAGLLFISKNEKESYQVELTGFYYESGKDKEDYRNTFEKQREIQFHATHKTAYDYLQKHFAEINHKVKWDRLVLEVKANGGYTPHYEFEGDEVSPDAPPEPEKMTIAYLCKNLKNCLAHNAPDNYEWMWEILERTKEGDGRKGIAGKFYYSLHEDKSNAQPLEPGEYIYMYNVSEQLFDEFLSEKTEGWTKMRLDFSRQGKVHYDLLERE